MATFTPPLSGAVAHFLGDLRSCISGRSLLARRGNRIEHGRKWVRRYKLVAAGSSLLAATVALSTAGVLWKSAEATHQRNGAQDRLHDLVRLTGKLEGELYNSAKTIPQSTTARTSLLRAATQTLNSFSASDSKDPALAAELGGQYAKLAHLQTEQVSAPAYEEARNDIARSLRAHTAAPSSQ
ncbi:MAG: hypothetical protein M3Y57_13265 [Acidobacteriota bacterium]|nr:hypothetical protein [Acidobacteriota bacterium]